MAKRLALVGGDVITGRAGERPLQANVILDDGAIVAVGSEVPGGGDEVVDISGKTVLPGLIDAHVHLTSVGPLPPDERQREISRSMERLLAAGFTTVRDLGAIGTDLFEIRASAERGERRAPRLVLCGQVISAPCPGAVAFPGMYREAATREELVAAVHEQADGGADVIKVMSTGALTVADEEVEPAQLGEEELRVLTEAAHARGLPVASHAEGSEGIAFSVNAGVDTIEHGEMGHLVPAALDRMAERGTVLVPTLSVFDHVAEADAFPPWMRERAARLGESGRLTVGEARRRGVAIAVGADAPPQGGNAQELLRLTDAGLSTLEAIIAATSVAALACRVDSVGRIEEGMEADLVVVEGDPSSDIRLLADPRRLAFVIQAGAVVARNGMPAV